MISEKDIFSWNDYDVIFAKNHHKFLKNSNTCHQMSSYQELYRSLRNYSPFAEIDPVTLEK